MTRTVVLSTASALGLAMLSSAAFAETRVVDLDAFTSASFTSNLKAKIVVGGPQSVSFEGVNPADLDDIRFEIFNGQLRVWRDSDIWDFLSFGGEVTMTISVPKLDGVAANAASVVEASGITGETLAIAVSSAAVVVLHDVDVFATDVEVSSAGSLVIDGKSNTARIETSSAGRISASDFEVVDVDITASSASQTAMFASGRVTADASSAATITIVGNPLHVDDDMSSGADVDVVE